MLYLDYAKVTPNGYILNFFADKEADLADISNGKRFVTKNGMDYGVPQPSSTVVITMPDKTKKTYVLNEAGEWQEGGVDMDYSKLENAPIILANLAEEGFVPEANTYYEHLGETTENFINGIIYLYDGKEYKAIDGSGSGGGVQSDYNQNDSTAADYIKNRPFYEENSLTEVADFKVISGNLKEVGSEVTVEYNGERFTGTVTEDSGRYEIQIKGSEQFGFGGAINITDKATVFYYAHKKTYEIKSGDEIIFNKVKYLDKSFVSGEMVGKFYISDGEIDPETLSPISSASFVYVFSMTDEGELTIDYYAIYSSTTNIDFNIKANQQTIKTIDPKFIKDMYYETTTQTELFNGVVDITKEEETSVSERYYSGTLSPSFVVGVSGDTCEVTINETTYMLDVAVINGTSFAGTQDFRNGIPVYVQTSENVTTIGSKTSYVGANVIVKNIHADIKQVPLKYIPQGGEVVGITINDVTIETIASALETYLKANTELGSRLRKANEFTLFCKSQGDGLNVDRKYHFISNYSDDLGLSYRGKYFQCIDFGNNVFADNCLSETFLLITTDNTVLMKQGTIYDTVSCKFQVGGDTLPPDEEQNVGKLGFFWENSDGGKVSGGNTVSLSEWIKYAQQRADFAIPTPTKDTDLVDKKYVYNAISTAVTNAITTALNTEV